MLLRFYFSIQYLPSRGLIPAQTDRWTWLQPSMFAGQSLGVFAEGCVMGKKKWTSIQFEDIDKDGYLDTGVRKVLVGDQEAYPHTWSHDEETEREIHEEPEDALNRYEKELLPIVKPIAKRIAPLSECRGVDLARRMELDFGDGMQWYGYPFLETVSPLYPGDPIEMIDPDQLAEQARQGDAWTALWAIDKLRKNQSLFCVAIQLGRIMERLRFDENRPRAIQGTHRKRAQVNGGHESAKATPKEKLLIIEARNKLAQKKEWPKLRAAKDIAAQLRTGEFPGIERRIEYTLGYIADLRPER